MSLEDYIRQQEKKLGGAAQSSEVDETKAEGRDTAVDGAE